MVVCHAASQWPVCFLGTYALTVCLDFFIPIMGRSGHTMNPELFVGTVTALGPVGFCLFTVLPIQTPSARQ